LLKNARNYRKFFRRSSILNVFADIRQLPTSNRSIRLENRSALLRRWRFTQSGQLLDPSREQYLFPEQRDLLRMLEVMSEAEVVQLADCGTPLFQIQLRLTDFSLEACAKRSTTDLLEEESRQESFLALAARLDSVRTSFQQACLLFNLSHNEAAWISRFCPQELHLLARDPAMVLVPAVNPAYFIASATRKLTSVERTVLGSVARGRAAAMH
jgi:hypothetical protein